MMDKNFTVPIYEQTVEFILQFLHCLDLINSWWTTYGESFFSKELF